MPWVYDRKTTREYQAGDQGVRFWFDEDETGDRVAVVIDNPALQRLGGDGDRDHMIATFDAHEARIVAGAVACLKRKAAPPIPNALRLRFGDLPPA